MKAYHFVAETLRDGRPVPPDGEWLVHKGPLEMCAAGYHACVYAFDALRYAPGFTLCAVELDGNMAVGGDKVVAEKRMIIKRRNASKIITAFSRRIALQLDYAWNMPPSVYTYLSTGDRMYLNDALRDIEHASRGHDLYSSRATALEVARKACKWHNLLTPSSRLRTIKDMLWRVAALDPYYYSSASDGNIIRNWTMLRRIFQESVDYLFVEETL